MGTDLTYDALTDKVYPWSYEKQQNRYVNTAEMLREAIVHTPNLQVLVVSAYYDLATPFFSAEYTFNHLGLDPSLQGNVRFAYCDAGHMLYTYKPCLDTLQRSMADFYRPPYRVLPRSRSEALDQPLVPRQRRRSSWSSEFATKRIRYKFAHEGNATYF